MPAKVESSSDDDVLDVLNPGSGEGQVIEVEVDLTENHRSKEDVAMDLTFMKRVFAEVDTDETGGMPRDLMPLHPQHCCVLSTPPGSTRASAPRT